MAFTDDFNRASLGSAWEAVLGTWITASSLYLKPNTQYTDSIVRVAGSFPNDQYAEVWIEIINDADISIPGPAVRIDATGANCYLAVCDSTSVNIYKKVSGSITYLSGAVWSPAFATLIKVKLVVTGTSLDLFVSDVSLTTATDSAVTAGNIGCRALTGQTSTLPRFDDFAGTDIIAGGGGSAVLSGQLARRRRLS